MIPVEISTKLKTKPDPAKYGFGQFFSDHIFVAKYQSEKGWYDSRVIPFQNFSMHPAASVLHYGQAMFEGMKAFRQKSGEVVLFRPEFNAKRMQDGAKRLCMQAPPTEIFVEGVKKLVDIDRDWVPSEFGSSLYIRPTLIGTEGFLGVRPSKEYVFFVILSPVGSYYSSGSRSVKIWVEKNMVRATPGGLGATKAAANYAASLFAAEQARARGFAQVLWLDHRHEVVEEVGTMNVMFVIDGKLVTPPLAGSILAGGTRECCLTLAKKSGFKVEERSLTWDELRKASSEGRLEEAFGTGTAAMITPISELVSDEETIKPKHQSFGPIGESFFKQLTDIQYGNVPDTLGWTVKV